MILQFHINKHTINNLRCCAFSTSNQIPVHPTYSLVPYEASLLFWNKQFDLIKNNLESLYETIESFDPITDDGSFPDNKELSEVFYDLLERCNRYIPKPYIIIEEYRFLSNLLKEKNNNNFFINTEEKDMISKMINDYITMAYKTSSLNQEIRIILCILTENNYEYKCKLFNEPHKELVDQALQKLIHIMDKVHFNLTIVNNNTIIEDEWTFLYTTINNTLYKK